MSYLLKFYKKRNIISPVNGKIVDIEDVNDVIFSHKILGNGLAIKPSDGYILSPCNGKIECILVEKHALFISCEDNTQILLHLGLDTVEMHGDGFDCLVSTNQKVHIGSPLINIDLEKIKHHKKDDTIIVVIPHNNNTNIIYKNKGKCIAGQTTLFKYKKIDI